MGPNTTSEEEADGARTDRRSSLLAEALVDHDPNGPTQWVDRNRQGAMQEKHLNASMDVYLSYWLRAPASTSNHGATGWPLILFLHGANERGIDLQRVLRHGLPRLVQDRPDGPWSDFLVLAPQCTLKMRWWEPSSLLLLLDNICTKYPVDPDRIYVTGSSLGGYGAWSLISQYPERFAAAIPICGGGIPILTRYTDLENFPVWVFHGARDAIVPLSASQAMVNAFKAAGAHVQLTVYPNVGHDAWTQTYENELIYSWLLQHRRTDRPHRS